VNKVVLPTTRLGQPKKEQSRSKLCYRAMSGEDILCLRNRNDPMKKIRRRFEQVTTFRDRVESFAEVLRSRAKHTPSANEKKQLLRRAAKAETAMDIDEWISGSNERPALLEVLSINFPPRAGEE